MWSAHWWFRLLRLTTTPIQTWKTLMRIIKNSPFTTLNTSVFCTSRPTAMTQKQALSLYLIDWVFTSDIPQTYEGAFCDAFILQTFAAHLTAVNCAQKIEGLDGMEKEVAQPYEGLDLCVAVVSYFNHHFTASSCKIRSSAHWNLLHWTSLLRWPNMQRSRSQTCPSRSIKPQGKPPVRQLDSIRYPGGVILPKVCKVYKEPKWWTICQNYQTHHGLYNDHQSCCQQHQKRGWWGYSYQYCWLWEWTWL